MEPKLVPPDDFDRYVVDAFASLPQWVRDAVGEVAIMVEDRPDPKVAPRRGRLLGIFHGISRIKRGDRVPGSMPDKIVLYRIPILTVCATPDDVPGRIRSVLLHEIGHAIGMSERRLREMGVA